MSFIKKKDKWKRLIVFGVGWVIDDYNGNIVTESEPSEYGTKLKFKLNGGYKLSDKASESGERKWLSQKMNFAIKADHPLAPIVRSLEVGDCVDVFGVVSRSKYTNPNTGKEHNYFIVNLEKIVVLYNGDGKIVTPTPADYAESESQEYDDDLEF